MKRSTLPALCATLGLARGPTEAVAAMQRWGSASGRTVVATVGLLVAWSAAAPGLFVVRSATAPVLFGARPVAAQEAGAASLTPLEVARMERALEQRFACLGCHRVDGRGGMIGPVLDGLRDRAGLDYVLSVIRDPVATIPGTRMPHQPMPGRESERLARYLLSLPERAVAPAATPPEAPPTLAPADSLDGDALYARHCAACHGATGAGDGWNAGNLPVTPTAHADPTLMAARPDDTLYDAIATGGWVLDKSTRMPAFGEMLSPAQIRALVVHIRTLCDCTQPAWAGDGGPR